jgi:hypothetical protein
MFKETLPSLISWLCCRIIFMSFGLFSTSCYQKYLAPRRLLMNGSRSQGKMINMRLFSSFIR